MSGFKFRKATRDDIPAAAKIYDRIIDKQEQGKITVGWVRGVYPTEKDAEGAFERGELFVCEYNGEIVASAVINQKQPDVYSKADWEKTAGSPADEVCVLHTLTVSPDITVRGCGSAFVRFYESYAAAHGCRYLRMDTNEKNARARSLYAKLGYSEADIVGCTFNGIRGINLVCLEKRLPVCVRKYSPRDKEDLRFICRVTADRVFKRSDATRTAVTLLYNDYFTEHEPQNIFVLADEKDRAVGYIICCTDFEKFRHFMLKEYMPKVAKVCPPYAFFALYAVNAAKKMREYPHLHMDILPEYQRKGWGTKLMDALRRHLKTNGFNRLSVCGAAKGSPGCKMYTRYGFSPVKTELGGRISLIIDT